MAYDIWFYITGSCLLHVCIFGIIKQDKLTQLSTRIFTPYPSVCCLRYLKNWWFLSCIIFFILSVQRLFHTSIDPTQSTKSYQVSSCIGIFFIILVSQIQYIYLYSISHRFYWDHIMFYENNYILRYYLFVTIKLHIFFSQRISSSVISNLKWEEICFSLN